MEGLSSETLDIVRDLARTLAPPDRQDVQLMQALVQSVGASTCTVRFQGSLVDVPGVKWLTSVPTPVVGQVVEILYAGPGYYFILGVRGATAIVPVTVVYPWLVDVDVLMTPILNVGSWTLSGATNYLYGGVIFNGGNAVGDNAGWDVVLGAGTWTLEVMRATQTDSGKEQWAWDDGAGNFTNIGLIDDYAGVNTHGVVSSLTGLVVSSTIKRRLRVTSATKNASSTGQYLRLQHLQLRRTS